MYLDTQTGVLSYKTSVSNPPNSLSAAASVLNFLHLGQGTAVAVPIAGEPGYYNAGPGLYFPSSSFLFINRVYRFFQLAGK